MSAKHTITVRLRLRTMEADDARLTHLEFMTGTGHGISRIPRINSEGAPMWRVIEPGLRISYREPSIFSGPDVHTYIGRTLHHLSSVTIVPEQAELMTEVDMNHYRALCREKRVLEVKLRKYVVGHSWFIPHISPFGADRFRKFDATPAVDLIKGSKERWCNRISGY